MRTNFLMRGQPFSVLNYEYGLNGSPLDLNPQDPPMSETSAEHHTKAAEHHEHAARHHKEAAKH
jgi:hypothetical protein